MKIVQVEQTMKRKIVRIKRRTGRSFRKKTIEKVGTTKTKDESAGWISVQKKVTATSTIIAHTVSFDDENENGKTSRDKKRHLLRLVWTEKRKATRDTDSQTLHTSQKRVKLDKVDKSSEVRNPKMSNFQPDCDLIISWL